MAGDDFPAVGYGDWLERVRGDIDGDPETLLASEIEPGLVALPLATAEHTAGAGAFVVPGRAEPRTAPLLSPLLPTGAPDEIAAALLADLAGGTSAVRFDLDRAARSGLDAASAGGMELTALDGLPLHSHADLAAALEGVHLEAVPWTTGAGGNAVPAAALAVAVAGYRADADPSLGLHLAADPLGALARDGELSRGLDAAAAELGLLVSAAEGLGLGRVVEVSTLPCFEAGADPSQELAWAAATTIQYLRWIENGGLAPDEAAPRIGWEVASESDVFVGVAKLRAARVVWERLLTACDVTEPPALFLRISDSRRGMATASPWTHLLRSTTRAFVGLTGGADEIAPRPLPALPGHSPDDARRLARNVVTVLQEESHLAGIADPATGSYHAESLTSSFVHRAWERMRKIEEAGGMVAALGTELVHRQIEESRGRRARRIAGGDHKLVGVTDFLGGEAPLEPADPALEEAERAALAHDTAERLAAPGEISLPTAAAALSPDWFASAIEAASAGASIGDLALSLPGASATRIRPLGRFHEMEPRVAVGAPELAPSRSEA